MPQNNKKTELPRAITPHGGYLDLKSYQMSEIVYYGTVAFCNRFIGCKSRTHDQTVQTARSVKQNITEESMASGTSKKNELKLVGVARTSIEKLHALKQQFLNEGEFSERLYTARYHMRKHRNQG